MKLKPKYWEVLELNYFRGHTNEGFSDLLGMPLGTVKTRIKSGLAQLREMMD